MKNKIIIIVLSLLLLIVLGYFIEVIYFRPAGKEALVSIKPGQGTRQIAQTLKNQHLISSSFLFSTFVYTHHYYLQNGVYKITAEENLNQIVEAMRLGKISENIITVPEGWRTTQIDDLLSEKGIIAKNAFNKIATQEEGYLFPDTYFLELNITSTAIRNLMLKNFQEKTTGLNVDSKTLIIASIVEREAKFDNDRARIAGVYLSRLDQGMKLEADPTIQYAKGSWAPITTLDYKDVISPYNTYLNAGLPPGPICNPGIKSIDAVLHPTKDGSLYFFTDSAGHAVFSKTLDEQNSKLKQK